MRYQVIGDTMPAVEVVFDAAGETMYTQSGLWLPIKQNVPEA